MAEVSQEIVEGFKKFNTPNISDALDRLGINGQLHGIKPLQFGYRVVGPVFTVKYIPVGRIKGTAGDFLDDVPPGAVLVIDNGGRDDCTVWGDIMTKVAARNKIGATVIDGVCRDVDEIIKLSYPMYTKGHYMRTGKDRVMMSGVNVPVSISNIQVNPGDIAVADDSGVVVIPVDRAEEVLKISQEIFDAESKIEAELAKGLTLVEAREKFKYHKLQSRE